MVKSHWALVVGLNYYPGGENLAGCVRDAESTKFYLENNIKEGHDIVLLTASTPSIDGTPPPEQQDTWPTCSRLKSQLQRIVEQAKKGDSVYIHYSGHGTRGKQDAQLALLLLDDDGCGMARLRTRALAKYLGNMVAKGLVVTLVLDCCFSGAVVRDDQCCDFDVRYLDFNPAGISSAIDEERTAITKSANILRDGSTETEWLVNPQGYTILSACAPDQRSFEITKHDVRQGALTHFLLRALEALRLNKIDLTHRAVHQHISAKFHSEWPRQVPMRYGNASLGIFGQALMGSEDDFVPIYEKDGALHLRAGDIHGVSIGDEYVAYPFATAENDDGGRAEAGSARLRVVDVKPFESDLTISTSISNLKIETGWKAQLLRSHCPRTVSVGLPPLTSNNALIGRLGKESRYVHLVANTVESNESSCDFHVIVNKSDEYEILDATRQAIPSVPTVPCHSTRAQEVLVNMLRHLAKYKYFESMENRKKCEDFQKSFSLSCSPSPTNSGWVEVSHDEIWNIEIVNTSSSSIYVAVFNFRSSWEVVSNTSENGRGDFEEIPSQGTNGKTDVTMKMTIPSNLKEQGTLRCDDHFKIFVTNKPISYHIALPSISQTACGKSGVQRGSDDPQDLLEKLYNGLRGEEGIGWATQSFLVRTNVKD